jgi:DNA-binding LytR/AlgR family response regulator
MINCIIVADNETSTLLKEFCGKYSSINLTGSFSDSVSVQKLISEKKDIGLILLDPGIIETDCFDFINSLEYQPNIIIVSSDDQNAMKAFDFNVVDYLLKPISFPRFCKAVDKAVRYFSPSEVSNSADTGIFIKKGSSLVKLKFGDIVYIEALENYVILNTRDDRFTIHFTMKGIENQLPRLVFRRIHRSFIVNKSNIQSINESSLDIKVADKVKNLPIGKSFREQLLTDINVIAK